MNQHEIDWEAGEKMIGYVVGRIAARLPSHIDAADLHSVGVIGLLDAANKFDPERGNKFATYAEHRVKGAILDELRSMDWVSRGVREKSRKLERAYKEVEQTLGREASGAEVASFLDIAADEFNALQRQASALTMQSLDAQGGGTQRGGLDGGGGELGEVVADHKTENQFAALSRGRLEGKIAAAVEALPERERLTVSLYYYEDLSLKEIGLIFGVSESRVCQIHTKATKALKASLTN
jgi:RNA polymerase sigma factor for flagellar operon FliA